MDGLSGKKLERELAFNILRNNYLRISEIARELLNTNPPPGFNQNDINAICSVYDMWENQILNTQSKNIATIRQYINEFLTYYNEANNPHVELFWKKLKEENIPFERVDLLAKILKRKRIKNQEEYDFVVDTMVPRSGRLYF